MDVLLERVRIRQVEECGSIVQPSDMPTIPPKQPLLPINDIVAYINSNPEPGCLDYWDIVKLMGEDYFNIQPCDGTTLKKGI